MTQVKLNFYTHPKGRLNPDYKVSDGLLYSTVYLLFFCNK